MSISTLVIDESDQSLNADCNEKLTENQEKQEANKRYNLFEIGSNHLFEHGSKERFFLDFKFSLFH